MAGAVFVLADVLVYLFTWLLQGEHIDSSKFADFSLGARDYVASIFSLLLGVMMADSFAMISFSFARKCSLLA